MGVVCYLCQRQFANVEELLKHMTSVTSHNLNQYSDFKCAQPNCLREYTGSRSFVRHIRKEHTDDFTTKWDPKRLRVDQDVLGVQDDNVVQSDDTRLVLD